MDAVAGTRDWLCESRLAVAERQPKPEFATPAVGSLGWRRCTSGEDVIRFTVVDSAGPVGLHRRVRHSGRWWPRAPASPGADGGQLLKAASHSSATWPKPGRPGGIRRNDSPISLDHAALDYCVARKRGLSVVDPRTEKSTCRGAEPGVVVFNRSPSASCNCRTPTRSAAKDGSGVAQQPTDRVHRYELPTDWSLVPSRATVGRRLKPSMRRNLA